VFFTLKLLILSERRKNIILEINNLSSQNVLTLPRELGDDSRPDSVGKPLPGIDMLVSNGLIRTRCVNGSNSRPTERHTTKLFIEPNLFI